jgi:hypothetical protein
MGSRLVTRWLAIKERFNRISKADLQYREDASRYFCNEGTSMICS